jgi:hypothetical protein
MSQQSAGWEDKLASLKHVFPQFPADRCLIWQRLNAEFKSNGNPKRQKQLQPQRQNQLQRQKQPQHQKPQPCLFAGCGDKQVFRIVAGGIFVIAQSFVVQ